MTCIHTELESYCGLPHRPRIDGVMKGVLASEAHLQKPPIRCHSDISTLDYLID